MSNKIIVKIINMIGNNYFLLDDKTLQKGELSKLGNFPKWKSSNLGKMLLGFIQWSRHESSTYSEFICYVFIGNNN